MQYLKFSWILAICVVFVETNAAAAQETDKQCLKLGVFEFQNAMPLAQSYGREAFAMAGTCVEYVSAPVRRTEALVKSGSLDGELMRTKIWAQRLGQPMLVVPTPIFIDDILAVYLRSKSLKLATLDDLKGSRVVITGGHRWAEEQLRRRGIEPLAASTKGRYLELLHFEQADVGLLEKSGLSVIQDENLLMTSPVSKIEYHIVLQQKHAGLLPKLDSALKKIRAREEKR